MRPIVDYHMHTPLCGHAEGEPDAYAAQAVKVGLEEIGFSDHAPFVIHDLPGITMRLDELPTYYQMIEEVQSKYQSELSIKVGIEADFVPGYEEKTKKILADYPYDYVIGSVHFINNWAFDDPEERKTWDQKDIDEVYSDYYNLLRQSAQSGLFDIMAHVDLVKKFGHRAAGDFTDEIKKTAQIFKECGVVVEINTSGIRKPVGEMYPEPWILEIYQQAGVPLTFGSDAHVPGDVGRDFDKAITMAREAGYTEYVLFKQRQIERVIQL